MANELRSDCRTCRRHPTFGPGDKVSPGPQVGHLLGATTCPTVDLRFSRVRVRVNELLLTEIRLSDVQLRQADVRLSDLETQCIINAVSIHRASPVHSLH